MADAPTHPTARPELEVNEVDDGLVIYDTGRDRVHYLNHTAALVFVLCTGEHAAADVAAHVAAAFDLPADRATSETDACLAQLAREGLVS